jgi:zinc D-Ala-D-Ala carboxypeptidase
MDTQLSPHFTLDELTHSQTAARRGMVNTPDEIALANMRDILCPGLEQIRKLLGRRLLISSGYRSMLVNAAVGGAPTSQHTIGLAADFTCPAYGSPLVVAHAIQASDIRFDQLIYEFDLWVHVSFSKNPRRQVLTIDRRGTRKELKKL